MTNFDFELESLLIDQISKTCIEHYNKLSKTGKPLENEWTVLSCIVKYQKSNHNIEVVSLGTGSKCVGATKMSPAGDILNDSHAEVFARRGFLLYLYDNVIKTLQNEPSIFSFTDNSFELKEGVEFIFYSSQLPCGDASIVHKSGNEEDYGEILETKTFSGYTYPAPCKKRKLNEDIHRTGAKCLPNCIQDSHEPGINYHLLGQVRTKPGRGDRTLSMSCSDKMAKWIHLGIQGSLLSLICGPIYMKCFIFGAGVPYSEETLKRALLKHSQSSYSRLSIMPKFYQSTVIFTDIRSENKIKPASGSIVWVNNTNKIQEVAVQGKKLGVIKQRAASTSSFLCISKYNLYKNFICILISNTKIKQKIVGEENVYNIPYNEMKRKSKKYLENWLIVKDSVFKSWTTKPDMWNFCVDTK